MITDEQLNVFRGRVCRYRTPTQPEWVTSKLVAIYSECVSFNGVHVNRDGLQVQAVNGSTRPLETDMSASELSGFLERLHQMNEA